MSTSNYSKTGNENDTCKNKYVLVSFQSSHHAIRGEKVAEGAITDIISHTNKDASEKLSRLVPLPPEISAGCGLVLRLPFSMLQAVLQVFSDEDIAFEDVFIVECEKTKTYTKLSLDERH